MRPEEREAALSLLDIVDPPKDESRTGVLVPERFGEYVLVRLSQCLEPELRVPIPLYSQFYPLIRSIKSYGNLYLGRERCVVYELLYWGYRFESMKQVNDILRSIETAEAGIRPIYDSKINRAINIGILAEQDGLICFNYGFLGNFLDFGPQVDPFENVRSAQRYKP
jgi:hypothetical protein